MEIIQYKYNAVKVRVGVVEIKTFYKNQKELASAINEIVDLYWRNEMKEEHMVSYLKKIISNNKSKLINDNGFTPIIVQRCGKRRLDLISNILRG